MEGGPERENPHSCQGDHAAPFSRHRGGTRERLPSDPSTAGIVCTELISFLQPLTRELAAQAIEGAQRTHAVACMRELSTEDWVEIPD